MITSASAWSFARIAPTQRCDRLAEPALLPLRREPAPAWKGEWSLHLDLRERRREGQARAFALLREEGFARRSARTADGRSSAERATSSI